MSTHPGGNGQPGERRAEVEAHPAHAYLRLFPQADVETLARVIDAVHARKEEFVQQWHDLYVARLGEQTGLSDRLFHEAYLPYLRSAVLRLGAGDVNGFVYFAAILGEHLAQTGVPFAVLVAQLNLLKESCLRIIGEQPGGLSQGTLMTVDKLTACCITAAADSYYRRWREPGEAKVFAHEAGIGDAPGAPGPLPGHFHGLVGDSASMRQVFEKVRRAALGRTPVLIVGETGTGKELIARAIHACGPRRAAPFVAVNCAALPRELIESELFGYRRGAFSGANADHLGLFRAANGGTVLLDEITEMCPELQAKLLRVVQEGSVRPVGAVEEVRVDVRFIASTNRDPETLLGCGALRSDLYYRLSVGTIAVPPLRERGDDILLLVEHCLGMLNQRHGDALAAVRGISTDAMAQLRRFRWPGNVRELFNVLDRAFSSSASLHIGAEDLGLPRLRSVDAPMAAAGADATFPSGGEAETYAEGERALIRRSLAAAGGNKTRAARQLGISRKKLYAKLAKYTLPVLMLAELADLL